MSDPSKQERIEEFLRKSLLGDELVNTQFHLFSAKSSPSGRVTKPRVLCANNVLLAKSSKYFLDLLSSDINPSDPSLIDLTDDNDVPNDARIDEYGYGSDSDLDDCDAPIPEISKDRPTKLSTPRSKSGAKGPQKSDDDSESDSSDMFVLSPERPNADESFFGIKDASKSAASSETAVQDGSKKLTNQTAVRLRSLGSRHVLVKDTAFQTWYMLLNYLYTNKFNFLPLGSAMDSGASPESSSTNPLDVPKCSAKSMYRLACKVGLDDLRDKAFSFIQSNLTEHNVLQELSCSLVSRHPPLLEMELDVLYSHIASPVVVANFAALAQRIANKELPHGADIIVGIHTRLLKEPHPLPLKAVTTAPTKRFPIPGLPGPTLRDTNTSEPVEVDPEEETSSQENNGTMVSGILSPRNEPAPSMPFGPVWGSEQEMQEEMPPTVNSWMFNVATPAAADPPPPTNSKGGFTVTPPTLGRRGKRGGKTLATAQRNDLLV